jgi:hypothetical protein
MMHLRHLTNFKLIFLSITPQIHVRFGVLTAVIVNSSSTDVTEEYFASIFRVEE